MVAETKSHLSAVANPQTRTYVSGGRPDDHFPIPVVYGEFERAPEIEVVAERLIASGAHGLSHLDDVDIGYLWKAKGGKKGGKENQGKTVKPSGLTSYFGKHEFIVWIAVDNCAALTRWQMEALVYHELSHIAIKDTDDDEAEETLEIVGHDVEEFHAVMALYPEWNYALQRTADVLQGRMAGL